MADRLYVGVDIGMDYTQIVCLAEGTKEPQSIGLTGKTEQYLIPTCAAVSVKTKEWFIGEEAKRKSVGDGIIFADRITERIVAGELSVKAEGQSVSMARILERYLRKTLLLTKNAYPDSTIIKVVITNEKLSEKKQIRLEGSVRNAMASMGIGEDRLSFRPHSESLLAYVVGQKRTMWQNDTAVFEFRNGGLHFIRLGINHRQTPMLADISDVPYEKTLTLDMVKTDPSGAAATFAEIANKALEKQLYSVIYAAGNGFDSSWADEVLVSLCSGRKVYKGHNLYAKGACYLSAADVLPQENVVLLEEENLTCGIYLKVYLDGREQEIQLAQPAVSWKEAGGSWELIADEIDTLEFRIRDIRTGNKDRRFLKLEGLPERERRMTRLELKLDFTDERTCHVAAKDLGFGTFVRPDETGEGIRHEWETSFEII